MCEFCSVHGECCVCKAHEDGHYRAVKVKRNTVRVATVATLRIPVTEVTRDGTDNRVDDS